MEKITKEIISNLIDDNPDMVEFGLPGDFVGYDWITKAENVLGVKFSDSYIWFLETYSGGDICGDEIYSIYGMDFDEVVGCDIVYMHKTKLKNKTTKNLEIVVTSADLGEVFYFNYREYKNGECPIYLKLPSGASVLYAENFYEFLSIFGKEENSIVSYKLTSNKGMPYFYNPKESLRTFEDYPSTYTPSSIECSCGNKKVKHAYLDNWHYKFCPWVKKVTAANKFDYDPAIMNMVGKDILPFFLDMSFNVYMCNQCNNLHVAGLDEKQKPFIAEYALLGAMLLEVA